MSCVNACLMLHAFKFQVFDMHLSVFTSWKWNWLASPIQLHSPSSPIPSWPFFLWGLTRKRHVAGWFSFFGYKLQPELSDANESIATTQSLSVFNICSICWNQRGSQDLKQKSWGTGYLLFPEATYLDSKRHRMSGSHSRAQPTSRGTIQNNIEPV